MFSLSLVTEPVDKVKDFSGNVIRMLKVAQTFEVISRAANPYCLDADATSLNDVKQAEAKTGGLLVDATKLGDRQAQ